MRDPLHAEIKSRRLSFRVPDSSDARETAAAMTPEVARWLVSWTSPVNGRQVDGRIRSCRRDVSAGTAVHFVLRSLEDHALIGWISAWQGHPETEWELGFWIGEAFQDLAYGSEAAAAMADHVDSAIKPTALSAIVRPENERSIAILERLGMTQVGDVVRPIAFDGSEQPFFVFRRLLRS